MARLIIVAGASGAGKTFILSQLSRYRNDIVSIKKLTTRGPRASEPDEESIDLHFGCKDSDVKKCEYKYPYCGHNYGIRKSEIESLLQQDKCPIVIVANCNTIARIKKDYRDALVFYIHTGLSGDDLREQLLKYKDPVDVEERMMRQRNGYNEYSKNRDKHIFDYTLINYFDDSFIAEVDYILEEELAISNYENYIFVIMSFDPKYDEVYEAMKLAGKLMPQKKLVIERVSEHKGDYIITEHIENSINKAELVICDVSEKSPNVYYELGYARARNKTIVMTANNETELPFDIRQHKTNFYSTPTQLQKLIYEELVGYYGITE